MSRALSQRASQKPSRPASKRPRCVRFRCPAFGASSRQRWSSFSKALSSTSSFFDGWRSTPGTDPGDEPARQAHLDHGDQRAVRFEGREGIELRVVQLLHGVLHRFRFSADECDIQLPHRRRVPHSISLGGLLTPAPGARAPPPSGRHPQTFTTGGNTCCEQMFSAPRLIADIEQWGRHVRVVPDADTTAVGPKPPSTNGQTPWIACHSPATMSKVFTEE